MRMSLARNMGNLFGLILVLMLCAFGALVTSTSARNCAAKSALVGLSSDFVMVQHQLRGSVLFLDDCTFKVTRFDMIPGSDVYWWGSLGDDFDNMTQGFSISPNKLNQTYENVTMEITLDGNYTWDDFKVLSVWDKHTGSDFGHVFLEVLASEVLVTDPPRQSGSGFGSPAPAPAPGPDVSWALDPKNAAAPSTPEMEIFGHSQPTMFDNCVSLKDGLFRLRWTVNWDLQSVDLGLEGALTQSQYMAFGWAKPGVTSNIMLQSDVVLTGFDEDVAYAEDYYLGDYQVCNWDTKSPSGVCPDYVYTGGTDNSAISSKLVHGQQIDGITLIRYRRPFEAVDPLYDISINASDIMQVVFAIGKRTPDTTKGIQTPQQHLQIYGYRNISLVDTIDECLGPMVAENGYLGPVVVADRGSTLVVSTDAPSHYPDRPFPDKVFYINQKEAPLLRVERGVPVTFSVQAGHGFAFYITDNPVGGASNAKANAKETIYAGGPEAHGVPVIPFELTWHPNRTTPDLVYYQDYFMEKRGWKVQVVDGGLSDMYNQSTLLADGKVTLFWTVSSGRIYLAVRGEVKSGYVAIAFGSGMVNSFSYVGWVDEQGLPQINGYWMDGKKASSIYPTGEELTDQKCEKVNGIVMFEFSRALQPPCNNKGTLCKNVIDPHNTLKVVWAMGGAWSSGNLADSNMHTDISTRPTLIQLETGVSEVEELQPVLAVHGFMMFIAWGLLLPGGVLGARYLKHLDNNGWFEIHIYSQLSAIVVMLLGLLFAIAELHGFNFRTTHMKVGLLSILTALVQAGSGYLRPKKASHGESQRPQRVIWQYLHMYTGRSALILGFLSLMTGISQLAKRDGKHLRGLQWVLFAWFLAVAAVVGYIEVQGFWSKKAHGAVAFDRILGTEDGAEDQLAESHGPFFPDSKEMQASTARGTEIELEALH